MTRCIRLTAFAVLLSANTFASLGVSQELRRAVPLIPTVLKAGITIPEPCPPTASIEPKRYMIAWNDTPGIDGDFIFVVHPSQLFLRSGHNNPNPDFVYWVTRTSQRQYAGLVTYLDGYEERGFRRNRWDRWPGYTLFTLTNPRISPQPADRMTRQREAAWKIEFQAAVNANLRRILRDLNRGLPHDAKLREDVVINTYPDIVRVGQ